MGAGGVSGLIYNTVSTVRIHKDHGYIGFIVVIIHLARL